MHRPLIEYDDRSQPDEVIKLVERLILQDKVDFILPPWGTHMNLAVAPIINKHEYPVIFFTATALRIRELAKRWPYAFFPLAQPDDSAAPLGTMLATLKSQGKIKGRVAAVHVAEQTGVELHTSFVEACKKNGIEVVYSKSYPVGVSDLSPVIREAMQTQPDGFFAFSYPTDTFMLAEQSSVLGFNPAIYYSAVGTPFPAFKAKLGDKVNGVLLWGGLDHKAAGLAEYRQHHRAMYNRDTESGGGRHVRDRAGAAAVDRARRRHRSQEDPQRDRDRDVPDDLRDAQVQGPASHRSVDGRPVAERRGRRGLSRPEAQRAGPAVPEAEVVRG